MLLISIIFKQIKKIFIPFEESIKNLKNNLIDIKIYLQY